MMKRLTDDPGAERNYRLWADRRQAELRLEPILMVRMQRMSPVNTSQIRQVSAIFGGDHPSETIH